MPPDRERHIRNVSGILNNGAKYFASCFSERGIDVTSPEDKYRISPLGTRLYYSSQEELQELYRRHFKVIELSLSEFEGPPGLKHLMNLFFMSKP
jgi:hypothetical protein